jgi:hypothetical protein
MRNMYIHKGLLQWLRTDFLHIVVAVAGAVVKYSMVLYQ